MDRFSHLWCHCPTDAPRFVALIMEDAVRTIVRFVAISIAGCLCATTVIAEDYDYAVGLSYGNSQIDSAHLYGDLAPPVLIGLTATETSDTNNFDLTAAWYYSGLSDSSGPKSRAAFLSRASRVAIGYSRSDGTGRADFLGGDPAQVAGSNFDISDEALSVGFRHVWRDSGWYALAGVSRVENRSDILTDTGIVGFSEYEETAYSLGVGKYLGKATAVDISAASIEVFDSSTTVFGLTLSHVGFVGEHWQYGADVAYATSNERYFEDSYRVRGALYPTSNVEFGLEYTYREFEENAEVFAGWFVRDSIEISARYRQYQRDHRDKYDSDEMGVGVRVRF